MRARRGRPPRAAQSLDEALAQHYAGKSPARARNDHEREAMSKGRNGKRGGGRRPDLQSPTRIAAELAVYLCASEGISMRAAASRAAAIYGVNADNVRRYAARVARGPVTDLCVHVDPHLSQLVGGSSVPVTRPLLLSVQDVSANTYHAKFVPQG